MTRSITRRAARAAFLAIAGGLAACEIPSEAPILQQTWVVPGDSIAVGVAQVLPDSIAVNGGGTAFIVGARAPVVVATSLGALCAQPACQSGGAVVAPVPAFTSPVGLLDNTVSLPAAITSATVTSGTLNISVTNNLGFDPLRPNGTGAVAYGQISVTITSGAVNSTTNFNGATQAMPTAAVTDLTVPLPTGVYTGSITVAVSVNVPAGDPASMSSSNSFSVSSALSVITVSQATVVVINESIATAPTQYDLEDVDFADQVESGGFIIDIINPLTASAAVTLAISAPAQGSDPAVLINKNINIAATPTSSVTVTLSQSELQSLVGKTGVQMTVTGLANGTAAGNTVTVTPSARIVLHTKLQLILNVGA